MAKFKQTFIVFLMFIYISASAELKCHKCYETINTNLTKLNDLLKAIPDPPKWGNNTDLLFSKITELDNRANKLIQNIESLIKTSKELKIIVTNHFDIVFDFKKGTDNFKSELNNYIDQANLIKSKLSELSKNMLQKSEADKTCLATAEAFKKLNLDTKHLNLLDYAQGKSDEPKNIKGLESMLELIKAINKNKDAIQDEEKNAVDIKLDLDKVKIPGQSNNNLAKVVTDSMNYITQNKNLIRDQLTEIRDKIGSFDDLSKKISDTKNDIAEINSNFDMNEIINLRNKLKSLNDEIDGILEKNQLYLLLKEIFTTEKNKEILENISAQGDTLKNRAKIIKNLQKQVKELKTVHEEIEKINCTIKIDIENI